MVKKKDGRGSNPNSRKNLVAPGFEKGNTLSLKHGIHALGYLSPLVEEKEKLILNVLEECPYISKWDMYTVRILASLLARLEQAERNLDDNGLVVLSHNRNVLNPAYEAYITLIKRAGDTLDKLGLSPSSRAKLGVDLVRQWDFAKAMAEVKGENDK